MSHTENLVNNIVYAVNRNLRFLTEDERIKHGMGADYHHENKTHDHIVNVRQNGPAEVRWAAAKYYAWESRMAYRAAQITETVRGVGKALPEDYFPRDFDSLETETQRFVHHWLTKVGNAAAGVKYALQDPFLWSDLYSDWDPKFPLVTIRNPMFPPPTIEDELQTAAKLRFEELAGGPGSLVFNLMEGPDYSPNIFASNLLAPYMVANKEATDIDPFDRNRWAADTRLKTLALTHRGQLIDLEPEFDPDVREYTADIPDGFSKSDVRAVAYDGINSTMRPSVKVSVVSGAVKVGVIAADKRTTGTVRVTASS